MMTKKMHHLNRLVVRTIRVKEIKLRLIKFLNKYQYSKVIEIATNILQASSSMKLLQDKFIKTPTILYSNLC